MQNLSIADLYTQIKDLYKDWNIDWRFAVLGMYHEVGEVLRELPWRPWRIADQREPTEEELVKAKQELGDVIGTAIHVAMYLDMGAEDLQQAVEDHLARKRFRILEGIDGSPEDSLHR